MKNRYFLLFCFFIPVYISLYSCSLRFPGQAPYLINSIKVLNGRSDDWYIGAVNLSVVNTSSESISSMSINFDVYDIDGTPRPSFGENSIETILRENIVPGGEVEIEIPLDSLFVIRSLKKLTISRFCILKVVFSDGTEWVDTGRYWEISWKDIEVK